MNVRFAHLLPVWISRFTLIVAKLIFVLIGVSGKSNGGCE